MTMKPYFSNNNFTLYCHNCLELMKKLTTNSIDMIFADPPYMLSNDGLTCKNGKLVTVNKGHWDKSNGFDNDVLFHEAWLLQCKRLLKDDGTLWVSGTYHSIYQCGYLLQKLGFHILNDIAWLKPNAAPNLSCRFFTASHETLLWVRKSKQAKHYFNYQAMKHGSFPEDKLKVKNSQMRSVWSIPTSKAREKIHGKHPTQKPLNLLQRIIMSSTKEFDTILDPFNGSGTTGIAATLIGKRKYIGIDTNEEYLQLTIKRLQSLQDNPFATDLPLKCESAI
ncbi:Modification methylase DpnIIB [Candidatus Hepatincola sp. Av]